MRRKSSPVTIRVAPRQFIKVWQQSATLAEVASKLRMKKNTCRVRAGRYRQVGVPLKEFPPVEIEMPDWSELAEYAAELLADESAPSSDPADEDQDEGIQEA
jgi:hypothetical protein